MNSKEEAYVSLLKDRQKAIQENINRLRNLRNHDSNRVSLEIRGYEIELEELQRAIDDYSSRRELRERVERALERTDRRHQRASERERDYQEQIRELQELKERLLTIRAKRRVDRRIERIQSRIKTMQNRKTRCVNTQRRRMMPRYRRDFHRMEIRSRQQARVEQADARLRDNEALKSMLNRDHLIDNIRERIYDIRGTFYQRRKDREQEVLNEMNSTDSIVRMRGARITRISRHIRDHLRERTITPPVDARVATA